MDEEHDDYLEYLEDKADAARHRARKAGKSERWIMMNTPTPREDLDQAILDAMPLHPEEDD